MASLNLDLDYFTHPKVKRLVGLLGKGSEVLPLRLWCYCGKYHSEDGRLVGISTQEIESIIEWWGENGEAVKALVQVSFLEKDGRTFVIHDWLEHSGHIAALKQRASVAAKERWRKYRSNAPSIAKPMLEQCPIQTIQTNHHPPTPRRRGARESREVELEKQRKSANGQSTS